MKFKGMFQGLMRLLGQGGLSARKIDKITKLATNPFAQPDVRMREMQRLLEDGSEEAVYGALKRFTVLAQGLIADENEKKWLEDAMVKQGQKALAPLRTYIQTEQRLSYALRAYQRMVGPQEAVGFFLEVLQKYGPEDHRSSEAKLQLIAQLGEHLWGGHLACEHVLNQLSLFLSDHSDDVRWAVLDLWSKAAREGLLRPCREASAAWVDLVQSADVSVRIGRQAAAFLAEVGWALPADMKALSPALEDGFFLDKKRRIHPCVVSQGEKKWKKR